MTLSYIVIDREGKTIASGLTKMDATVLKNKTPGSAIRVDWDGAGA